MNKITDKALLKLFNIAVLIKLQSSCRRSLDFDKNVGAKVFYGLHTRQRPVTPGAGRGQATPLKQTQQGAVGLIRA